MALTPKDTLSEKEVEKGLKMVIWDGLAGEVTLALTGSTFIVAMALLLGATNIQIGLLGSLPTLTNLAQLISIWLVKKFNNRRAIAVYCTYLARIPLVLTGCLIMSLQHTAIRLLLFFSFSIISLLPLPAPAGTPG